MNMSDDTHMQIARLLVELLKSTGLTRLVIGGAWIALWYMLRQPSAHKLVACSRLLEMDICKLAATNLRAFGSAAEWVVSAILMRWLRCIPPD